MVHESGEHGDRLSAGNRAGGIRHPRGMSAGSEAEAAAAGGHPEAEGKEVGKMTNNDKIAMFKMRLEGATYEEIAKEFGVTRQRIHQIMYKAVREKHTKSNNKIVYPNIRKWLEEKELTTKKFAQLHGLNYGTIWKALQRDEMSTKTANQILKATGLTYEEAFRKEE